MRITKTRISRIETIVGTDCTRLRNDAYKVGELITGMTLNATGSQQPIVAELREVRRALALACVALHEATVSAVNAGVILERKSRASL